MCIVEAGMEEKEFCSSEAPSEVLDASPRCSRYPGPDRATSQSGVGSGCRATDWWISGALAGSPTALHALSSHATALNSQAQLGNLLQLSKFPGSWLRQHMISSPPSLAAASRAESDNVTHWVRWKFRYCPPQPKPAHSGNSLHALTFSLAPWILRCQSWTLNSQASP